VTFKLALEIQNRYQIHFYCIIMMAMMVDLWIHARIESADWIY